MKNRLKKKDIVLMIIILVVAGSCMLLHRIIGEKSADYITVKVNGKIEGVYSLADDQEIVLNNGSNVLKIKNGEADMIRADCPDQLCGGRSLSPWRSGAGGTFRHGQGHGVIHPGK